MKHRVQEVAAAFGRETHTMARSLTTDAARRQYQLDPDYEIEVSDMNVTPAAWRDWPEPVPWLPNMPGWTTERYLTTVIG